MATATHNDVELIKILTDDDLKCLLEAYEEQPQRLTLSARAQVVSPFPEATGPVSSLGDYFFRGPLDKLPMLEVDRERGIIGVLVATDIDPGYILAVHFYWGLSVGLTPKQIADIVLLSSMYSGIPHWAVNIHRFSTLLTLLKNIIDDARVQVEKGKAPSMSAALDPDYVSGIIRKQFAYATLDQIATFENTVGSKLAALSLPAPVGGGAAMEKKTRLAAALPPDLAGTGAAGKTSKRPRA